MVIGVRKKAASKREYLWSWHLWITDYAPEYTTAWKEGVYAYPVEGGSVHRYPGNSSGTHIWDTKYRNKYIMDRNLGAFAANSSGGRNAYGFYYQFGRKDPFPHSGTALYDIEGNPQQDFTTSPDDCIQRIQGQAYLYEGVQLPYGFTIRGATTGSRGIPIRLPRVCGTIRRGIRPIRTRAFSTRVLRDGNCRKPERGGR